MSEKPTIQDRINSALSEGLTADGEPGMVTGFVLAAEFIDAGTGRTATWMISSNDQPTHRSLGLIHYAREFAEGVLRSELMGADEDEDE